MCFFIYTFKSTTIPIKIGNRCAICVQKYYILMINQRDFKKNPNFIHTFAAKDLGMYSRVDKTAGNQTDYTLISLLKHLLYCQLFQLVNNRIYIYDDFQL